jgi:hypothetical protein
MATVFAQRDFFAVPTTQITSPIPTDTYRISGSESALLINASRGDLSVDEPYDGLGLLSSYGWFAGPDTSDTYSAEATGWGIIVGGNPNYTGITAADSRISYVSMWGFQGTSTSDQNSYDEAFIELVNSIFGTTYTVENLATAKTLLNNRGYYYQWPVGLNGQSRGTGTGSDV